ncbi:hypothetical protein JCM5353_001742, partial [Sporobolomyces roseus]
MEAAKTEQESSSSVFEFDLPIRTVRNWSNPFENVTEAAQIIDANGSSLQPIKGARLGEEVAVGCKFSQLSELVKDLLYQRLEIKNAAFRYDDDHWKARRFVEARISSASQSFRNSQKRIKIKQEQEDGNGETEPQVVGKAAKSSKGKK